MTRRFVMRGRVQGVGFRWFAVRHARRLGVTGFVRNRPDGTVEVVANGGEPALAEFERELAIGPRGAEVLGIESEDCGERERFNSFEVR